LTDSDRLGQPESVNRTQVGEAAGNGIAIRLASAAEPAALGIFFAGLSLRTRYQRFFAPVRPTQAMLRRMAGNGGDPDVLVALRAGVIVGHAMAADRADPGGERTTDIGVVVDDSWQGLGIGSALTRELIRRAQRRGVTSVTMDVLHSNQQVLAMITSHWAAARIDCHADCVAIRAKLAQPEQPQYPRSSPSAA
jgi:GNAT superfamily N-acetyltransferase